MKCRCNHENCEEKPTKVLQIGIYYCEKHFKEIEQKYWDEQDGKI